MEACVQFFCWLVFHSFLGRKALEGGWKGFPTLGTSMTSFSQLASAWAYSPETSILLKICTLTPGSQYWDEDIQIPRGSLLCFKDNVVLGLHHPFAMLFKLFESLLHNICPLWCNLPASLIVSIFRLFKVTGQPSAHSETPRCLVLPTLVSQRQPVPPSHATEDHAWVSSLVPVPGEVLPWHFSPVFAGCWTDETFATVAYNLMLTVVWSKWLYLFPFSALTPFSKA